MFYRILSALICFTLVTGQLELSFAQGFSLSQLPIPGTMVERSVAFTPVALKGIVVNTKNPLALQFILDTGKKGTNPQNIKEDANLLLKYFLTGLTVPEKDLWVNLSPYEKDRIIPNALGQTALGRDLLAQDYILKQLTASLINPEKDLGHAFWQRVYKKAQEQFGTTNIPVNTFNKVWILPNEAQVYENKNAAYVTKSTLKVMLDQDYVALNKFNKSATLPQGVSTNNGYSISSQIVREIVIPEIEKEINTGKNFAPLRQIYQALILAKWYKETVKNALFEAIYTNKNKIAGVNIEDTTLTQQIYTRYLEAYKKGVFNFVKESALPNGKTDLKKYFSGGLRPSPTTVTTDGAQTAITAEGDTAQLDIDLAQTTDKAMGVTATVLGWLRSTNGHPKSDDEILRDAMKVAIDKLATVPILSETPSLDKPSSITSQTITTVQNIIDEFNQSTFFTTSNTLRTKLYKNRNLIVTLQTELIKRGFFLYHYSKLNTDGPVLFVITGTKKVVIRRGPEIISLLVQPANPSIKLPNIFYREILQFPGIPPFNLIYMPDIDRTVQEIMTVKQELATNSFKLSLPLRKTNDFIKAAYRNFVMDDENKDILDIHGIREKVLRVRLAALVLLNTTFNTQEINFLGTRTQAYYNQIGVDNRIMMQLAASFLFSTQVEKIWLALANFWELESFFNDEVFTLTFYTAFTTRVDFNEDLRTDTRMKLLGIRKNDARTVLGILYKAFYANQEITPELDFDVPPTTLDVFISKLKSTPFSDDTSKAMSSPDDKITDGGIDLKKIELNREGKKVIIKFDAAQLNQIITNHFNGFNATINNIFIIRNPLPLLGIVSNKEDDVLVKA